MAPIVGVSPGFIETLGGQVVTGRLFSSPDFDSGAAPVAVVNEPFVGKFFGGRNPVGRRIRVAEADDDGAMPEWREIIGVVPDLGIIVGDDQLAAGYYVPLSGDSFFYLVARTEDRPVSLVNPIRRAAFDVDPEMVVTRVDPLEAVAMKDRIGLNVFSGVLMVIGGVSLVLALVGMYAIVSFTITRRTREIGIRVALGAGPRQILRSIFTRSGLLLLVGGLLGAGVASAVMRVRGSIFASSLPDSSPWIFPIVLFLLIGVGIAACWVPARRALGISPREALGYE